MGVLTRMIPESNLKYLKNYSFHSGGATHLDVLISRIWWTPVANMLPRWLSPNVLTLLGAFCVFVIHYCIFLYVPDLDCHKSPGWIHLLISAMMILYLTFDGIDGKQARKLGVSSPLGQLMDHGVDALVSTFYPYMCFTIFPGGFTLPVMLLVAIAPLHVLSIIWRESEFSTFDYTVGIFGVTETNLCVVLLQLLSYFYPAKSHNRILYRFGRDVVSTFLGMIPPGYLDLFSAVSYVVVFIAYFDGLCGMVMLFLQSGHRLSYVLFVLSSVLHTFSSAFLVYCLPRGSKVLGCMFASTLGAAVCVNNIVRLLAKAKLRRFHLGLLPHYLLIVYYFGAPYVKGFGYDVDAFLPFPVNFDLLLYGVVVYGFVYLFLIFARTCREITSYLGISFLTVPAKAAAK